MTKSGTLNASSAGSARCALSPRSRSRLHHRPVWGPGLPGVAIGRIRSAGASARLARRHGRDLAGLRTVLPKLLEKAPDARYDTTKPFRWPPDRLGNRPVDEKRRHRVSDVTCSAIRLVDVDSRRLAECVPYLRTPWLARPGQDMGSTSIPRLAAKAIVDMLAVVRVIDDVDQAHGPLHDLGWVHAPEPRDAERRVRSFCTPNVGQRSYHLHVVEEGPRDWQGWLAFRDYLRAHPGLASAYAALKRELAAIHGAAPNRREPYRQGKRAFIHEVTEIALATWP